MNMKILIISIAALAATSAGAFGQNLAAYKSRLAQPAANGARVTVTEAGDAAQAVRSAQSANPSQTIEYYRVEIFFDTSPNARKLAYETYAEFRELFPEIPADEKYDINYTSPKYSVRVGYFLTREEAIAMCGRLRGHFKNAYPRADHIEISKFAERAFPQHAIE